MKGFLLELRGANSEQGETTEFHLSYALILAFSLGMHSEKLTNGSLISFHLRT